MSKKDIEMYETFSTLVGDGIYEEIRFEILQQFGSMYALAKHLGLDPLKNPLKRIIERDVKAINSKLNYFGFEIGLRTGTCEQKTDKNIMSLNKILKPLNFKICLKKLN